MSDPEITLSSHLLEEFFGEIVEKIGVYLIKKGVAPLRTLVQGSSLDVKQVKKALCVLLQHQLAYYTTNSKNFIEYGVHLHHVLLLPRYPRYIYTGKMLYGDAAELLLEELLQHGQCETTQLLTRVQERLSEAYSGERKVDISDVQEKMTSLAQTHFIQRAVAPIMAAAKPVADTPSKKGSATQQASLEQPPDPERFAMPANATGGKKRKIIRDDSDDEEDSAAKRRRLGGDESPPVETGVKWQVNHTRFQQYFRDQVIISAIARKLGKNAGEILRTILRISEVKTHPGSAVTVPISCNELYQALPAELSLSRQTCEQYLTVLEEDSMGTVMKLGESGGGQYSIHLQKAMSNLCTAHVESVIQERFGSKCLRIFRLLVLKKQLEQKQIEDCVMIPAKETKEMLYRMFGEHFISLTEVPRTPDHAPSRTFYLFSVNFNKIARMLLQRSFKAMANLISRRKFETKENKRLLDKQQRVEAITLQLEASGADPEQRKEIEEMITPPERALLTSVKHRCHKLEQSELQLDDTIFTLHQFLYYSQLTT